MSSNTSTLTAKMNGSPAVSTQKKMISSNYRPPSYAAALKSGVADSKEAHGENQESLQFPNVNEQQPQQTDFSNNNHNNINMYPPLGSNMGEIPHRTSRAFSEPIRLDQFDNNVSNNHNNRLDFPFGGNSSNGWFDSSNSVLAPLNDRSSDKLGMGSLSNSNSYLQSSNAFPSSGVPPSSSSNEFSLFSTPSRSGSLFGSEVRSQPQSGGGGGPPSPEAWSKLINGLSHNESHPPKSNGLYSLLNGNDGQHWGSHTNPTTDILHGLGHSSFGEGSSLFPEATSSYRQRSASRDENGSLILGITQQARNSRSNSDVEFLQSQRRYSHDLLESSGSLSATFSLDNSVSRPSFDQNNKNIWGSAAGGRR
jgi:hypothetical protein